ncbi:glycosyltransferase [Acidithiobacillus sp.]|uniref:glycosyltransferase n=1 Tax=Acidithiobacillus sp. TaxID=1872118 RepID=UPI00260E8639|nr:glycosyltransferase [Acidithiobacillus sp.]MDD2748539.1 glycosyltransferase [Acidithiobacillus sp.]MDD5279314.1 glycosyltransferase [Acidithiobacillus sp.]
MIFDINKSIADTGIVNSQKIVILEGLQLADLWLDIRKFIDQRSICILRMHNLESDYHKSVAVESRGIRKVGHKISSLQYKLAENRLLKDFDFIYSVSQSEMDAVKIKYPEISDRLRWVPPIPDGRLLAQIKNNDDNLFVICYFGDLTLPNNNGGLHWFCSNVLPLLDRDRFLLRVAGKGSEKFNHYDNVEALGFVNSIEDFVSNSHLIVAPIFSGAGVKIKVLDAMATGKPLLTSPKGCEGLSPDVIERMNVADHYQEWISTINHISNSYSQVCNASLLLREVLMTNHSSQNFIDRLSKDVDTYNKSISTMIE